MTPRSRPAVILALAMTMGLVATGCSDEAGDSADGLDGRALGGATTIAAGDVAGHGGAETDPDGADPDGADPDREPSRFEGEVRGSAEQVIITGAEPGQSLTLVGGAEPRTGTADDLGNLILRDVAPGDGYRMVTGVTEAGATDNGSSVGDAGSGPGRDSETFAVLALDDHPDTAFYETQSVEPGFGYIETRDGTLLSVMVRLPGPVDEGPYPTVVEYSGYTPSDPDQPQPAMGLAEQLGYATVGVNMRGTGCSGGAFDYFEPLQSLDGYDAIEVISRQPWVAGGQVGMVGLSYPGIAQLFVAQYRPPGLKAITPMSVIEDTYRSTLYPGGILNVGFAKTWADDRQAAAEPLAAEYAQTRVAGGDEICAANQLLRSQAVDLEAETGATEFYDPETADRLSPRTFVDRIDVPVFLAGQWQDEQTGGRFATMLDQFSGTDVFRAHLANGAHADGFGPTVLLRWAEFLDFYVAETVPDVAATLRALIPFGYADTFGVAMSLPADRFDDYLEPLDYDTALAAYEAEPPVLVLLESGGDPAALGGPAPRSTVTFDSWPPPGAQDRYWSLTGDPATGAPLTGDSLTLQAGQGDGSDGPDSTELSVMDPAPGFVPDPEEGSVLMVARQAAQIGQDSPGNYGFADLDWPRPRPGSSLAWTSEPLDADMLLAGSGSVELTLETEAADVDIEVTVSEIRPDGTEVYVQTGWLRASHRALDSDHAQDAVPWHTHREQDLEPIDGTADLTVEIFPAAHPFRAGSRVRLTIDTPGGSRPEWAFDVLDTTDPVSIISGVLRLPMVAGLSLPDGYPACSPGLRSQPCRTAR